MSQSGLGRGLGSLIPNKNAQPVPVRRESSAAPDDTGQVLQAPIANVGVNPRQPRRQFSDVIQDELVGSIKEYGVIQPLVVSRDGENFELIAGERRLRAAKQAGLTHVPVIIRNAGEQEKLEIALIENIQRENLNPVDLARGYKRLLDEFSLTQEEVARRVGKARSSVTNSLRLLHLPDEIQAALIQGQITEGHAKYLSGLDGEEKQLLLFRKIMRNKLTIEDTHKEVRRMGGTKAARIKINYTDKDKEFALREFFGAKVEIKRKGKGGQIIIDFYSDDELGEIIEKVK